MTGKEHIVRMSRNDIIIQNLSKAYGKTVVFSGLSCTFGAGKRYCLTAPSGAGKTTLFKILLGLEKQDSGEITGLKGQRAGAVFQEDRLLEDYSALSNIRFVTGNRLSVSEINQYLLRLLPKDALQKPVREFSGGMKRRLSVLRALLAPSDFILMDEPFAGLDQETRLLTLRLIGELRKDRLLVVATHDPFDAELLDAVTFRLFD